MAKEYTFCPRHYFVHTWYKYMCLWFSTSSFFCLLMIVNSTLTIISAMIVILFFCIVTILLYVNRIRTLKKSRLKIRERRIDLILFQQDGYDAHIALGRRSKICTYTAIHPHSIGINGKTIVVKGDIVCVENKYDSGINVQKERRLSYFRIPPYFPNWEEIKIALCALNGGNQNDK